jgi:hypothetical protein
MSTQNKFSPSPKIAGSHSFALAHSLSTATIIDSRKIQHFPNAGDMQMAFYHSQSYPRVFIFGDGAVRWGVLD